MSKTNLEPNKPSLLFEIFTEEELKNPKMKGCIQQVMDFEYGICFGECLNNDLTLDEIHEVAVIDSDLRMKEYNQPAISKVEVIEINNDDEPEEESEN